MKDADIDALKPGDVIWKWWDTGAFGVDQMKMTVVRVNRKTVTVERYGRRGYCPRDDIEGVVVNGEFITKIMETK